MDGQQTLAQIVRAKYPGAYTDLTDQKLEELVSAKYPGVYDDLPRTQTASTPKADGSKSQVAQAFDRIAEENDRKTNGALATALSDAFIGALKGGGETAFYLGKLMHKVPGVSQAVDAILGQPGVSAAAFDDKSPVLADLQPTNAAQGVGKFVERVGEMVVPAGKVGQAAEAAAATVKAAPKLAKVAVEAMGGAAMSAAQGGDPVAGAVLGGVVSGAGSAAKAVSSNLKNTAEQKVMQALGPTKERYKAMAEKITPEMLKRGIKGSREAIQARAQATAAEVGERIDDAIQQFGRTHDTNAVWDALEAAKAPYLVQRNGTTVVLDSRPIKQLEKLQQTLADLGPDPSTEHLVAVRRAWDSVASQAGGYAQRAHGAIGMPLKDQSEAWAKREGANAIRRLLADDVPELAALNKEYAFWKNLDDVVSATLKRTQPQKPGLAVEMAKQGGQAVGAVVGSSGGPVQAGIGAALGRQIAGMVESAVSSPSWRLVDANLRNKLADAIVSGNRSQTIGVLSRIAAARTAAATSGGR